MGLLQVIILLHGVEVVQCHMHFHDNLYSYIYTL